MRATERPSNSLFSKQHVRRLLELAMRQAPLRESVRVLAQAGIVPPGLWKRLPVETDFRVSLPGDSSFMYNAVAGDAIGRALFWQGIHNWESETLGIFYYLARDARLVIDVGANTGGYTLLACASNPHLRVIAFEPVPRVFYRLQANINLNNWQDRCDLHCKAVSDVEGKIEFHIPFSEVPTSASLHTKGFHSIGGELREIEVTTLDAVMLEENLVDLVKIDVEGFEDKVIRGMRTILELSRPTLIFECNPGGPVEQIESVLQDFGYRLFHLHAEGAVPVQKLVPDQEGKHRNFLATVRSNIGEQW